MISERQKELLQHMLGADERYKKNSGGSETTSALSLMEKIAQN